MALSYYHSVSAKPLVNATYWDILDTYCDTNPNQEAVIIYRDDVCIYRATFKQLRKSTNINTAALLHWYSDLRCGDRVGIVGPNKPEVFLTELAAYRLGLCAVFPPTGLKSGEDLITALKLAECKILIFETSYISKDEIGSVLNSLPSVKFAVSFGENAFHIPEDNIYGWDKFFDPNIATENDKINAEKYFEKLEPDMEAAVYFSSGSTGLPKAIVHSHFGIVNNGLITGEISKWNRNTKYFQDRPLSVLAGALFSTRMASISGGTSVIINTSQTVTKPDVSSICEIIQREKVNEMLLFGYMVYDFIASPDNIEQKLASLKIANFAGQVLNMEQVAVLQKYIPALKLMQVYGASEMNSITVQDDTTATGFTGKPIPHSEAKIVDENGKIVPIGSPGEVYIRTPMAFLYYITPDGMKSGKDAAGWYHTDDSGIMNEKGEIKILGRISDTIKRAGELIFPTLIEKVVGEHPLVQEVQVVGVSDARLYQDICACIIPADSTLTEDQLRTWCSAKFKAGRYEMSQEPTFYIFMEAFPRLASSKIDRKKLKALVEETFHGK